MRFAVDTGGTFTDLVVEDDNGRLRMFKAQTTPHDPIIGVLDSLQVAADATGLARAELLGRGSMLIHGTTRAINAIVTGNTARTALLVTQGHPDILVLREGGRHEVFNFNIPFPQPYVPRSLTFEVPERIGPDGAAIAALDEAAVIETLKQLPARGVEAIAVCLLWSIVNPAHEERIGALIEQHLPGMPFTLSHALNPSLREYRRASSAAIDASLKPLMSRYMRDLEARLRDAGFGGRVFVVTSQAGVIDAAEGAETPIHLINSGPAMAPVAGRHYVAADVGAETAVVADTGGTTYDVSLVRGGRIPWTRETWIGTPYVGHMTGFPSVDVRSIGAGGGSIAAVDAGGLLTVGPRSAGAVPGPVCYGKGGTEPTVTDCSLVLGHLDPAHFLGGSVRLDAAAARIAVERSLARPLGLAVEEAGGAAGLNSTMIGRRLGCAAVLVPSLGAALSAAGALMSELTQLYRATRFVTSDAFDFEAANDVLRGLRRRGEKFIAAAGLQDGRIELAVEARYANQVWEIEVPLPVESFAGTADVDRFIAAFHAAHEAVFAIRDEASPVEIVGWTARAACRLAARSDYSLADAGPADALPAVRRAYFSGTGFVEAALHDFGRLAVGETLCGPAIVESPFTTIIVDPGAQARRLATGSLLIEPGK
jgi:N-methylhydantoinase A